jgi:hypothetical protein
LLSFRQSVFKKSKKKKKNGAKVWLYTRLKIQILVGACDVFALHIGRSFLLGYGSDPVLVNCVAEIKPFEPEHLAGVGAGIFVLDLGKD